MLRVFISTIDYENQKDNHFCQYDEGKIIISQCVEILI